MHVHYDEFAFVARLLLLLLMLPVILALAKHATQARTNSTTTDKSAGLEVGACAGTINIASDGCSFVDFGVFPLEADEDSGEDVDGQSCVYGLTICGMQFWKDKTRERPALRSPLWLPSFVIGCSTGCGCMTSSW